MHLVAWVQLHHDTPGREPVVVNARERQMTPLVGVTNATMHRIVFSSADGRPPQPTGVFAFTDLSVRQEGVYRLRFHLFEIRDGEAIPLCFTDSEAFRVHPAKGFPGMAQSTAFTDILKKHGLRVRVSKSIRAPKRLGNQVDSEPTSPNFVPEDDVQHRALQMQNRPRASDSWVRSFPNEGAKIKKHPHSLHERRENYDDPGVYNHGMPSPAPYLPPASGLLPPPENARLTPEPTTMTPYQRNYDRTGNRGDYSLHYSAGPAPSVHKDRRENANPNYNDRWRPPLEQSQQARNHEYQQRFATAPLAMPYSPPANVGNGHYNPSRRFSTQVRSPTIPPPLPPFQHYPNDSHQQEVYQPYNEMYDVQTASRVERPNGQDKFGHQFQPPPTPVPLPDSSNWTYYSGSSMGYPGSGDQYHGG
jgi:hypothetical protein